MTIDLFSSTSWLDVDTNIGYGPLPIPQPRDREISGLLEKWKEMSAVERQAAGQCIRESQRFTLLAYSERMASFAIRTLDEEKIFLGLLALGVDGWKADWRDNAEILCLHFDAAKRIGSPPNRIFERAAILLSLKVGTALRSFLRRTPEDQSLEAMGYSVGDDNDGFRYRRDW
jgi:hypothetical protein